MCYLRLLQARDMGLHEAPESKTGTNQGANFYLTTCITPSPSPSLSLGLAGLFPKFIICLEILLGYDKAWLFFGVVLIVHRSKNRITTRRGRDEFYTDHVCVNEV